MVVTPERDVKNGPDHPGRIRSFLDRHLTPGLSSL
jgi:hypothetical protein